MIAGPSTSTRPFPSVVPDDRIEDHDREMAGKEEKKRRRRTRQRAHRKEQEAAAQRIQEGTVHTRCRKDKCCGVLIKDASAVSGMCMALSSSPDPLPVDAEMESHHKEHQKTKDAVQSMHPERAGWILKSGIVCEKGEPPSGMTPQGKGKSRKQIDTGS